MQQHGDAGRDEQDPDGDEHGRHVRLRLPAGEQPRHQPGHHTRRHEEEQEAAEHRPGAGHVSPRPPSTTMRWPVTKPAPSEARKLTAWATSSGVPMRPAGTVAR